MRISSILALTVAISSYAILPPIWAHGIDSKSAAWGLGGLMAGSMYSNAQHRRAQEQQPVANQQVLVPATVVPVTTTAAPSTMTAEQKIDQLNKLAAGGYISPAEYKAAKQAVVNSIVQ